MTLLSKSLLFALLGIYSMYSTQEPMERVNGIHARPGLATKNSSSILHLDKF